MKHAIILFDGICNLCQHSVQFIIKRDNKAYFRFASLQSQTGKVLIKELDIPHNLNTIILIDKNEYNTKSTAALKICLRLKGVWKLLYLFIFIPKPIRDYVYDLIANNRYRWFGKKERCMLPTDNLKQRFLSKDD